MATWSCNRSTIDMVDTFDVTHLLVLFYYLLPHRPGSRARNNYYVLFLIFLPVLLSFLFTFLILLFLIFFIFLYPVPLLPLPLVLPPSLLAGWRGWDTSWDGRLSSESYANYWLADGLTSPLAGWRKRFKSFTAYGKYGRRQVKYHTVFGRCGGRHMYCLTAFEMCDWQQEWWFTASWIVTDEWSNVLRFLEDATNDVVKCFMAFRY